MPKSLSIRTSLLVLLSLLTLLLLLTGGMGLYASTRIITSWVYYGVMTGRRWPPSACWRWYG
ncbi:methyl-accepting chemotaxis protein II [Citrobacter koseri]|nr:methyl-accepting chemotaxis protein II [Citrobacter koseri]